MTLGEIVIVNVVLDLLIVGVLAHVMRHATRWGSHDGPDPFLMWHAIRSR
jgi:hypothetical protein